MSPIICPNCSFDNPADSAYCENCGKSLTHECGNCGELLAPNARYCKHCGAPQPGSRPSGDVGTRPPRHGPGFPTDDETARLAALHSSMPERLAQRILSTRDEVEGERKQVTVLFTDIVDSTKLAEQMDPEQWATIVNGAHRLVTEQVYRYEGTVAQLLGDGVLCFFGAPVSHEDDPERAVRAGLGITAGVEQYARELKEAFGVADFQIRLGLNTGLVVVGKVGSSLHFEYLAIGDTVNLAARMQTDAHPNTILMTERTHRLVSTLFEFLDRGLLSIKGKSAPVHAYEVIGERFGAPKRRGVAGLASPMVGREREFSTLKRLAEELPRGRGAVVSLIGEAGLGKSRLLAEWRSWVLSSASGSQDHQVHWAEGRCYSYGVSVPFNLVVDLTRSLLDVPASLPEHEIKTALQEKVGGLASGDSSLVHDVYPFLAHLLSLMLDPEDAERIKYMEAQALQAKYASVIRQAFTSLAKTTPMIIVCEDIHWADAQSVELLSRLLPLVTELPILLCLVARPDGHSPGGRLIQEARVMAGVGAIELHLAALSDAESWQLVSNLMPGDVPDSIRELILSKSEGNPFFVEEVIGFLMDRALVRREERGWVPTEDLQQIEIPETIQGLLMARVDQLADQTRRTLQVASVIGREFSLDLLLNVLRRQENRENANR